MDGENLTGSADEFLRIVGHTSEPQSDPAIPEPEDESPTAAADSDSADEEEYDLSPEERVAAALGEDFDEDEDVASPELAADDDEDADPNDLDAMTPEQLRELAEEALRIRAEAPQQELATIQREANEAALAAVQEMEARIETAFQQEVVLGMSEPHYGALIRQAVENNDFAEVQRIQRAQRKWEDEQRAVWKPGALELIEKARTDALKQHPGIRRLYAQALAEDPKRNLPKKAIDEILEEQDTDRMHERADWLVRLRDVKADERRRNNQQIREAKAKEVSDRRMTAPATGRPKPAKVVPLKGTADEWLAFRKRAATG